MRLPEATSRNNFTLCIFRKLFDIILLAKRQVHRVQNQPINALVFQDANTVIDLSAAIEEEIVKFA
jgi:hypothetical protein